MNPKKKFLCISIPLNIVLGLVGSFLMSYGLLLGVLALKGDLAFILPAIGMIVYLILVATTNKVICDRCFRDSEKKAPEWFPMIGTMTAIVIMFLFYLLPQISGSFNFA